jgi:hypothetical protein
MYYSLFLQMGKWSNSYLFFRRTLKWDIKEYSAYITAYGLLGMVATYLLMPFLTDYLKLRDTTILMVRLKSFIGHSTLEFCKWFLFQLRGKVQCSVFE